MRTDFPPNRGPSPFARYHLGLTTPIRYFATGRGFVHAMASKGGRIVRQGPWVTVPPIRFTPREMIAIADDYFLHGVDLGAGDTVVDVGSGMGTELVSFYRRVGPTGRIFGLEAHPRSFEIAVSMKHLNDLRNVSLFPIAAWHSSGEIEISDDPDSLGINSVVDQRLLRGRSLAVRAERLDDVVDLDASTEVSLLKINVEGAELAVLEGAQSLLQQTRQVVVACHDFLAHDDGGQGLRTLGKATVALASAGFKVMRRMDHPLPAVRDTLYGVRE